MKSQELMNQAKAQRYLVLLEDDKKSSIKKIEKELKIQLVSSVELNSEKRAFQVMSDDTGIFYKNLNIAVVDKVPTDVLNASVSDPKSPALYWEAEQEFRTADEIDLLKELKNTATDLQYKLSELEELILDRKKDEIDIWKDTTWGNLAINMPLTNYTGKGVKLCILDTGLYGEHPDYAGRNIEGKSFIQGESWDFDGNGHGTHCTGTAAGNKSIDGKRYGIANEADLYIGKVLSDGGSGSTSGIIDAIDWALEKQCKVISMSLGSPTSIGQNPSLIFERAGERALKNGCILIAAAGNDSSRPNSLRPVSSPANAKSIMAIGAIDKAHNVAYFSNAGLNPGTGGRIDLSAPGVDVFSSYSKNANGNQSYKRLNGTSMATPHVAGVAALYWEKYPNDSASEIWLKLEKNAKDLNHLNSRDAGQGIVQAI